MMGSWACKYQHENGTLMQEYHIDCHPALFDKYVSSEENKTFVGNLSVRRPVGAHPKMLIGQDECIIKENIFSLKQWNGSEGQNNMRPKDDGHTWMLSAFVSCAWSFNVEALLTKEKLSKINMRQQQQHYIAIKSAIKTKGTSLKQNIVDCSPFCHFFITEQTKMDIGTSTMRLSNSKMWLIVWWCCFLRLILFFFSIKAAATESVRRMASASII